MIPRLTLIILGLFLSTAAAQVAEPTVVYLKNGQTRQGALVAVQSDRLDLRAEGLSVGSTSIRYDDIIYVDFSPTSKWTEAMTLFTARDFAPAAAKFEELSKSKDASLFYPAPGNLATLADRRLLDCYRFLMQPEKTPDVVKRIEWDLLPPRERQVQALSKVWEAVGSEQWDIAVSLTAELTPGDPQAGEIGYLHGLAHESAGRKEEALVAYGIVVGLFPGQNRAFAEDALRRMSALLTEMPDRSSELKAVVQIYAKSFGNGKLWDGAPAEFQELVSAD